MFDVLQLTPPSFFLSVVCVPPCHMPPTYSPLFMSGVKGTRLDDGLRATFKTEMIGYLNGDSAA
jgi:hypothetical protein